MSSSDGISYSQPEDLLHPLPAYRVVICKPCRYAVHPGAIPRHLKDIHRILRARRRPFIDYASQLDLAAPENVILPQPEDPPVSILPIEKGLACSVEGCKHLCVTEKRMQKHWLACHPGQPVAASSWHKVHLQTFFRGNLLQYFLVSPFQDSKQKQANQQSLGKRGDDALLYTKQPQAYGQSIDYRFIQEKGTEKYLLEHFINSTSLTFGNIIEITRLWQTVIPELARESGFLMNGILACSALHLTHINPENDEEFYLMASTFWDRAIPPFRHAVANVDRNNCQAILAFCNLLVIHVFVTKNDLELFVTGQSGQQSLPFWLHFMRTGCSMLHDVWDVIEHGPLSILASIWDIHLFPLANQPTNDAFLEQIYAIIPQDGSVDAWTIEERRIYKEAAMKTMKAFSVCDDITFVPLSLCKAIHIWPMQLSDDFLLMLTNRHPGALILLAYYAVLLHRLRDEWFIGARAQSLLYTIHTALDDRWRTALVWPFQELGLWK